MRRMDTSKRRLLSDIEAFIARTKMGESYFGKRATGNSELVKRLRADKRIWPETAAKVRSFIRDYDSRHSGHVDRSTPVQVPDLPAPQGLSE